MQDYNLENKKVRSDAWRNFRKFLKGEWKFVFFALFMVLVGTATEMIAPQLIGDAIDALTVNRNLQDALNYLPALLATYIIAAGASYEQIAIMGMIGQRVLYNLRTQIFSKLQDLPMAFFNANKAGDLISRINNDTEKINNVVSEGLIRLISSLAYLIGIAIAMLSVNLQLGAATLSLTVALLVVTQGFAPVIKRLNKHSLDTTGELSAQIQESLNGFKAIVAYNRQDFAKNKFNESNSKNRNAGWWAVTSSQILSPIYDMASNMALLLVIVVGLDMALKGEITFGVLFAFITYTQRFYQPLREFAVIWSGVQSGFAAWSRVGDVLDLKSNLTLVEESESTADKTNNALLSLKDVVFGYPDGSTVLERVNLDLEPGKTYALVGPTGGGKSTTASLMVRLYDPTSGDVLLNGRDIRTFQRSELAKEIGFILQDPYLFTGTLGQNVSYGLTESLSDEELLTRIEQQGLKPLLDRFSDGLQTEVSNSAENISLGQKQLIAFMRVLLRQPKLLILDEATANIDTITEKLLQHVVNELPKSTTKVIIAHRLNTIQSADEIIFVGGGKLTSAGDIETVTKLLQH